MALMIELLIAFLLAAVLSTVLALVIVPAPAAYHRSRWLLLFIVPLVATWAGGLWLVPMGPPVWGVHWLGFVIVALVVALLLGAVHPGHVPGSSEQRPEGEEAAGAVVAAFGAVFWTLVIALVLSIVAAYVS